MADSDFGVCGLGSEAAGKTCVIGGLAVLSSSDSGGTFQIRGKDEVSKAFIHNVKGTLNTGNWPPATLNTTNLHFDVTCNSKLIELTMADYAGEQFRRAINSGNVSDPAMQKLLEHIASAKVILLFLDIGVDLLSADSLSNADNQLRVDRLDALLCSLMDVFLQHERAGGKRPRPQVGIILTKSDQYGPELKRYAKRSMLGEKRDPLALVKNRAPSFYSKVTGWSPRVSCFAISAVGAVETDSTTGLVRPKCPLKPTGYEELFEWLLNTKLAPRRWRMIKSVGVAAAMIIALFLFRGGYYSWRSSTVADHQADLAQVADIENAAWWPTPSFEEAVDQRAEGELTSMKSTLGGSPTMGQLNDLAVRGKQLLRFKHTSLASQIRDVAGQVDQGRQGIMFRQIDANHSDFRDLAQAFLKDYPSGELADNVRTMMAKYDANEKRLCKEAIFNIDAKIPGWLLRRTEKIQVFVAKYGDDLTKADNEEIARAIKAATRLASKRTFTVTLENCGEFQTSCWQYLKIEGADQSGGKEQCADSESKVGYFTGKTVLVNWSSGEKIKITLLEYFWGKHWDLQPRSYTESTDPMAIALLSGEHKFSNTSEKPFGGRELTDKGYYKCEIEGFSEEDFRCLDDWVLPGKKWDKVN